MAAVKLALPFAENPRFFDVQSDIEVCWCWPSTIGISCLTYAGSSRWNLARGQTHCLTCGLPCPGHDWHSADLKAAVSLLIHCARFGGSARALSCWGTVGVLNSGLFVECNPCPRSQASSSSLPWALRVRLKQERSCKLDADRFLLWLRRLRVWNTSAKCKESKQLS